MSTTTEETDLDHYLAEGPIVTSGPFTIGVGGGGHPDKLLVCFGNGARAIAKLAPTEDHLAMAHNEVAARVIGKVLGSTLVMPTALRVLTTSSGLMQASLQLIAPEPNEWLPDLALYDEATMTEAAVIDYLVDQSDRMNNNYMGFVTVDGERRLVLVDHGYAFGLQGRAPASPFVSQHRGKALDPVLVDRVRHLGTAQQMSRVGRHLSVAALGALKQRIDTVVTNGCL